MEVMFSILNIFLINMLYILSFEIVTGSYSIVFTKNIKNIYLDVDITKKLLTVCSKHKMHQIGS